MPRAWHADETDVACRELWSKGDADADASLNCFTWDTTNAAARTQRD